MRYRFESFCPKPSGLKFMEWIINDRYTHIMIWLCILSLCYVVSFSRFEICSMGFFPITQSWSSARCHFYQMRISTKIERVRERVCFVFCCQKINSVITFMYIHSTLCSKFNATKFNLRKWLFCAFEILILVSILSSFKSFLLSITWFDNREVWQFAQNNQKINW